MLSSNSLYYYDLSNHCVSSCTLDASDNNNNNNKICLTILEQVDLIAFFFLCVCVFLHSIIIIINMWCPIYSKNDLFLLPSSSLSSPLSLSFFRTVCLFVYLFKLIFNAAGHFLLLLLFTSFLAAFRFIHLFGPSGCVCVCVLRCVEYDDYDDDHHHSWWWTIRQM